MDLFSLTCTTCKSRLKVRDQAAIGHILACPKCGGMVMVKPPEGWQPGMATPVAAVAPPAGITAIVEAKGVDDTQSESHFDAVDDLLSDAPPKARPRPQADVPIEAPGLSRPRFVGAPVQATPKTAEVAAAAQDESIAEAEAEALPDFYPPRPRRYWVLLAGSVAGGIALTVAVVLAINATRGDNSGPLLAGATQNPPPSGTTDKQPIPSTPATPAPVEPSAPDPATPAVPAPNDPVATPQPMPPVEPMPPAPALPVPMPPPAGDPLAQFDRILAPDADPLEPAPVATPGKAPLPLPPDPAVEPEPERPVLPRPAPREIDIAARLADSLPGIETDGTPLADFLQVMSDLSTIPITLEPDALPLVGATANSPVSVKLSNTTIGAALAAGVAQLKLETIEIDGHLVVRLVEPSPLKSRTYALKDLTGGDADQVGELAELFQALVEPASWGEGDELGAVTIAGDTLQIRQRSAAHAQLILLGDKLRVARGLPPAAKWLDPALFKLDTRSQLAQSRLAAPVTINFSQPTQLGRILRRLEEAGGVRILVDWRDVAGSGWNPDGEATLAVEKKPLAEALTALLGPMDLAWRIVDGQTLQVVQPETLASRCELELYKVADLLKDDPAGQALVARVRTQLGEDLWRDAGGLCEIRCDAAGQCLLVLLPQPQQQDLADLLAQWRSPKPAP